MVLWWLGDAVLLVVVVPLVVALAHRLLRATVTTRQWAEAIHHDAAALSATLGDVTVPGLVSTVELVTAARQRVGGYGAAVEGLL